VAAAFGGTVAGVACRLVVAGVARRLVVAGTVAGDAGPVAAALRFSCLRSWEVP
jgi:hypothetical protein